VLTKAAPQRTSATALKAKVLESSFMIDPQNQPAGRSRP
jgi:hypothetical protein